ncbi:MAG: malto-oligosyltrehalose synthase [Solirubrobacteraceae bacterium]
MSELRATYRLQLTSGFGFAAARELIPYVRDLGISHLYLSPSFQARPGSTHGYDVIDPGRLSDDLGGLEGFRALSRSAAGAGMGIVLDVVPNHMCADPANRYWADPELRRRFFDIDPVTGRHRRFFDIDELAGVRVEDPVVFEAMSGFVLGLVKEGLVDGLRVDHPDGLADPLEYLTRLRHGGAMRVWVEKILDPSERLRPDWPVSGSVGYEFLNDVAALFVDPAGESALTSLWRQVSADDRAFAEVAAEAKLQQAAGPFEPELLRLGRVLAPNFAELHPHVGSDSAKFDRETLAHALASLPVYRTYVDPIGGRVADPDRAALIDAVESGMQPQIAERLLLQAPAPAEFITRFQQTTPAITAKGVEDTAFYRYLRLLALNDVGGDPSRFGIDVTAFHDANARRQASHPESLLTTMTHDAKRSADVRARIGALAQVPEEFAQQTDRFMELTATFQAATAPDDQERYLIFQTLMGAWPIELDRLTQYVEKALREAKRNTNWITPNEDHEQATQQFCAYLYEDGTFAQHFGEFIAHLTTLGRRSALSQLALKLTSPGIPDIYQGDELEYRALVDPDNRRPVDWRSRDVLLRRLMGGGHPGGDPDLIKLQVTMRLLGLRARRPEPFAGAYEPLDAGEGGCAYVRGGEVLTLALLPRAGAGTEATLTAAPGGHWRDVISGVERSFDTDTPLSTAVGEPGFAVYERL